MSRTPELMSGQESSAGRANNYRVLESRQIEGVCFSLARFDTLDGSEGYEFHIKIGKRERLWIYDDFETIRRIYNTWTTLLSDSESDFNNALQNLNNRED